MPQFFATMLGSGRSRDATNDSAIRLHTGHVTNLISQVRKNVYSRNVNRHFRYDNAFKS